MFPIERKKKIRVFFPAFIVLLLFLLLLVILGGNIWNSSTANRQTHTGQSKFNPLEHCTTPYGTLLGYALGIPAFSNCHRLWKADTTTFVALGYPDDVRDTMFTIGNVHSRATGTPWNAAEYIYRLYYMKRGMTFLYTGHHATEFWGALEIYGAWVTERTYEVIEMLNNMEAATPKARKRLAPKVFDVVVWSPMYEKDLPEGHIAVVVRVEDDVGAAGGEDRLRELREERLQPQLVYIAEQNFDNTPWEGRNYSRVLRFQWKNGKEAVLQDPLGLHIIGRVRPGKILEDNTMYDDL